MTRHIQEQEEQQETTPLLFTNNTELQQKQKQANMNKKDAIFGTMTHIGLALFVALVISVLVRLPFNVFTYHVMFIVPFIVLSTEGLFVFFVVFVQVPGTDTN